MSITRSWTKKISPIIYTYENVGGSESEDEERPVTGQSTFLTKSSTEVLNWRQRVRRHTSAVSAREIDQFYYEGGWGSFRGDFTQLSSGVPVPRTIERWGQVLYPTSVPSLPSSWSDADNQARMRFYKRAREAQTAFRGLTFLGELRETLNMLKRPGQGLRRGLDDYLGSVKKRARGVKKKSTLGRIVSETWLEHAFGWSPFISDIKAAGDGLNRRLNRFAGNYTRIYATGTSDESVFHPADVGTVQPFMRVRYRRMDIKTSSVRYYGQVRSVCENPVQADMTLFGANWRELIPTAWELIPYSFLVDYFSNIGEILDAWSFRKSDIAWAGRSIKTLTVRTLSEEPVIDSAYTPSVVAGFQKWISRQVNTSYYKVVRKNVVRSNIIPALPSIQLEIPGLGTKWINMSALLLARNRTRRQLFQ